MKVLVYGLFSTLFLGLSSPSIYAANILKKVQERKILACGVTQGVPGFSTPDSNGNWSGIEVDICRSVATTVLGNKEKVKFVPLSAHSRFTALQSGEIDLLSRVTTWSLTRDTALGLNFAPTTYYDGQGFLVRKKDKVNKISDLDGATICTQQGTTTELNLSDYFRAHKIKMKSVVFESNDEVVQAFFKGRCDAFTNDTSGLVAERSKVNNSEDYKILKEVISKEPLSPAVRHGDDQWFDIVKWTIYALIEAEELGITQENVDDLKENSKDPVIRRFLGVIEGNGKALGLKEDWAYSLIKQMGNYGEVFERNLGKSSPLKLERGLNALWNQGGLMYAPPLR